MNKHESVLNTDKYDRRRFGQILDMSDRLQELEQKGKLIFPTFSPLMSDMWASLYKMKPSLLEEGEFDKEFQANHSIMDRVMKEEGFIQARSTTRLDDLSSALGAVRYSEKVYEWIEEQRKDNEELQKALDEAKKAKQTINRAQQKQQEAQEEKQNAEQNEDNEGQTEAERKQKKATKDQQKAEKTMQQAMQQIQEFIGNTLEQNIGKLSQALQQATDETNQAKEELINLLAGGGTGAGQETEKVNCKNCLYETKLNWLNCYLKIKDCVRLQNGRVTLKLLLEKRKKVSMLKRLTEVA